MDKFRREVEDRIATMPTKIDLVDAAARFMRTSTLPKYSYNFYWQDRPIIQYPQDIVAMQEIIWSVRPDLIIETGIAHGGSLIFSASMLALLDMCDAMNSGKTIDPKISHRKVLGIDIDIRSHNRVAIDKHPMASRIQMIEGSSINNEIVSKVAEISSRHKVVLVCLDSNHTHDHVLSELEAYAPLVTKGSYCVVFDTIIEDFPKQMYPNRPWGPGNNPRTAVWQYIKTHPEFTIDKNIQQKLLITVAPDGFLKRVE